MPAPLQRIPLDKLRRALEAEHGAVVPAAARLGVSMTAFKRQCRLATEEDPTVDLLAFATELRVHHGTTGPRPKLPDELRDQERQRLIEAIQEGGTEAEICARLGTRDKPWSHRRLMRTCASYGISLREARRILSDDEEREQIMQALIEAEWTLAGAAELLGYSRIKLDARIEALGLQSLREVATSRPRRRPREPR